ncbi:MAG: hypothetical protein NXI04_15655 [Planctomycetaceae bacterium]|nr:hypothetical protein [Planctomycetaceae bacterium]
MECVVFAPGIMGSALAGSSGEVWPPTQWEYVFGYGRINELMASDVAATDIIEGVFPASVYRSVLDDIAQCGYSSGSDDRRYIAFPYDWRKSNAVSAAKLADKLDSHFDEDSQVRITLLAHSMGGLVCRYLLESGEYADRPWFAKIKRLITMGTPHFGSPYALNRLFTQEQMLGVDADDIRRLAHHSDYPSLYELIPPAHTALTTNIPLFGELPRSVDPFHDVGSAALSLNPQNVQAAERFWGQLDLSRRPQHVEYFCFAGTSHETIIRNELSSASAPGSISRPEGGDGTVPCYSAAVAELPHDFSTKEHGKIFEDRTLRRLLYQFLDAPPTVTPQAAAAGVEDADVRVGVSLSRQIYTADDVLEISLSYDQAVNDLAEVLTLTYLDRESGEPDPEVPAEHINVSLTGAQVHRVSFSAATPRRPGFYRLTTATAADDPLPTILIIRGSADDA